MPATLKPGRVKKLLPPSATRRIKFVDRTSTTWLAVERYMEPVLENLREIDASSEGDRKPASLVRELTSHLYFVSLSATRRAAAIVPPVPMLELLDRLTRFPLSSESQARLAILRGVAACFERKAGVPVLVCRTRLEAPLIERIDEILEDAYLLEASKLRMFFSPGANWAALRRDLRILLSWVIRNRGWAKNAFRLGEQIVTVPGQIGVVADALLEIGVPAPAESYPALLEETHHAWKGDSAVIQLKYPHASPSFHHRPTGTASAGQQHSLPFRTTRSHTAHASGNTHTVSRCRRSRLHHGPRVLLPRHRDPIRLGF